MPAPLEWGITREAVAKSCYKCIMKKRHKQFILRETGLCISKDSPYIGCSTDGLVSCSCSPKCPKRLVELKFPWSFKDNNPKHAALAKGCKIVSDKLVLPTESTYYSQIQGQLGIYEYDVCALVFYTKKGMQVIEVEYDEVYFRHMTNLLKMYFTDDCPT